jgi:hypothetical protein
VVLGVGRDCDSGRSQGRASVRAEDYGGLRGTKIGWASGHIRSFILYMKENVKRNVANINETMPRRKINAVAAVEPSREPKPIVS